MVLCTLHKYYHLTEFKWLKASDAFLNNDMATILIGYCNK